MGLIVFKDTLTIKLWLWFVIVKREK